MKYIISILIVILLANCEFKVKPVKAQEISRRAQTVFDAAALKLEDGCTYAMIRNWQGNGGVAILHSPSCTNTHYPIK